LAAPCVAGVSVRDGVARFAGTLSDPESSRLTPAPASRDGRNAPCAPAALLGLTDAGGIVVLGGSLADCADAIAELVRRTSSCSTARSRSTRRRRSRVWWSVIDCRLPLGSVRAVALDTELAATSLGSATAALRGRGGRLVRRRAHRSAGCEQSSRATTQDWVAERIAVASPPVALAVRSAMTSAGGR
jgi:hypothetical protein